MSLLSTPARYLRRQCNGRRHAGKQVHQQITVATVGTRRSGGAGVRRAQYVRLDAGAIPPEARVEEPPLHQPLAVGVPLLDAVHNHLAGFSQVLCRRTIIACVGAAVAPVGEPAGRVGGDNSRTAGHRSRTQVRVPRVHLVVHVAVVPLRRPELLLQHLHELGTDDGERRIRGLQQEVRPIPACKVGNAWLRPGAGSRGAPRTGTYCDGNEFQSELRVMLALGKALVIAWRPRGQVHGSGVPCVGGRQSSACPAHPGPHTPAARGRRSMAARSSCRTRSGAGGSASGALPRRCGTTVQPQRMTPRVRATAP